MAVAKSDLHGFTLIEILVALSVAAVLATVAIPNFSDFIANSRARSEVQIFTKALLAARSEAVIRGGAVAVSADNGSWKDGWQTWIDTNSNGALDDGEAIKQFNGLGSAAAITSDQAGSQVASLGFTADGFLNGAAPVDFAYRTHPENCSRDRDIRVSLSGQVIVAQRACP